MHALLAASRKLKVPTGVTLALIAIVLLSLDLRVQSAIHTVVDRPIRADAGDYFAYAMNLHEHGVYSRKLTDSGETPPPDAVRPPGYPLFLYAVLGPAPHQGDLTRVLIVQAVLSTITVFLAFLLARRVLPVPLALGAAGLTALSPHLVVMNVYVLTETLFTFLVLLAVWIMVEAQNRTVLWAIAGLVLGLALLTRPTLQYLLIPAALFLWYEKGKQAGMRAFVLLLVGSLVVVVPWLARNVTSLGKLTDNTLMIATLHHGSYPDFMYRDDPRTRPAPYRYDPQSPEISRSVSSAVAHVTERFAEEPARFAHWYLIGKTGCLFRWSNDVEGMGDIFIYPVISTPYTYLPHFKLTYRLMRATHVLLMALGLLAVLWVWLPRRLVPLPECALFAARLISVFILYYIGVHLIGAPYPRYSIPLRPFIYIMATTAAFMVYAQSRRLLARAQAEPAQS